MKITTLSGLVILLILLSCRKDSFITTPDANVRITADTLKYDTVFTSAGSVVQSFKIINENDRKLRLSGIRLFGGDASSFNLNIDGSPVNNASEVEIAANDSIYVFVSVNVDPDARNLPFVIRDSIAVVYNGRQRVVQLEAWGQNAHFIRNGEVTGTETWTNDLPYVVLGYLRVNSNAILQLEQGCRLYFHANAPLVVNGTLKANGGRDSVDRVYFLGDRLDEPYRDYPGSWPGIYFNESSNDNRLQYAVIRNAYQAINAIGEPGADFRITLDQTVIDHAFDAGILAVNSSLRATNCLISNCGKNIVMAGGKGVFEHCTIVSYPTRYLSHLFPVVQVTDGDAGATWPLSLSFRNSILWGEGSQMENEVSIVRSGNAAFDVSFNHVLWKQASAPANTISNAVIDDPPLFVQAEPGAGSFNFRLLPGSAALDAGISSLVVIDLDGNTRPAILPDLGCYEQ